MIQRLLVLLFWFVIAIGLSGCNQAPEQQAERFLSGKTMGTTYSVKYHGGDIAPEQLQVLMDNRLIEINDLMSTYIASSELSRFNQLPVGETMVLSDATIMVIQEAQRLAKLSEGALDVTIGPLVNLWGFGPDKRPETIPSQAQIDSAKAKMGLDKIRFDGNTASKNIEGLYVDLSPIAKGYGVDELARILEDSGINNYLVEIGGEMRVSGKKLAGNDWRIAIEKPVSTERAIQSVITIGNNAIATSGDYRNYYEDNGVRYSHLINPETGRPIQHKLVSVTVVHPIAMVADALATALSIMGTERATALAEREDLAVVLITKADEGFSEYRSPAFEQNVIIHSD